MYFIIVFTPLFGAFLAFLCRNRTQDQFSSKSVTACAFFSMMLSWILFSSRLLSPDVGGGVVNHFLGRWVYSSDLQADWSLYGNALTDVMLLIVTTVSCFVHVFSLGYMRDDPAKSRFFGSLGFFTFAMLFLVTSDNFLQMFFGWEAVGVASYLLIGFWFHKPSANQASLKAFLVNRVGDAGFLIGIFAVFYIFGTLKFDEVFLGIPDALGQSLSLFGMTIPAIEFVCMMLFIGAMGKSAQFLLHTWLPDAMEGPTPVSALIHAATMVTAGVFMVCRLSPLFSHAPETSTVIVAVGAITAFFAATIALVQMDIKRVIAYSTCSQLGYMMFTAGLGGYDIAMFHLFTHASFKALLFLGAGAVIFSLHHEQNMENMGGLSKKMPQIRNAVLIGTLALTGFGIPYLAGLSGYYSKDAMIEFAYSSDGNLHQMAFWFGIIAACLTAIYSWKLFFMVFCGSFRGRSDVYEHAVDPPKVMRWPIWALAVMAVVQGGLFSNIFIGEKSSDFWGNSLYLVESDMAISDRSGANSTSPNSSMEFLQHNGKQEQDVSNHGLEHGLDYEQESQTVAENNHNDGAHDIPVWVHLAPFSSMLLGLLIAYLLFYRCKNAATKLAREYHILYEFLRRKWFFDELYHYLLVKPILRVGRFFYEVCDIRIIDKVVDGIATRVVPSLSRMLQRLQTGYIFDYITVTFFGAIVLIAYILVMFDWGA